MIFLISLSLSSWYPLSGQTSAEGTTGSNSEYSFKAKLPPWWIWFIAKAPWDFIILALSSRDATSEEDLTQ